MIKKQWKTVNLDTVCNLVGGGTPSKSKQEYYTGDIPWATVRDMNVDFLEKTELSITEQAVNKSSTNIIPKGNVIIATRVGLGKVCVLNQDTAINQDLKGVIPKDNLVSSDFLFWWFKNVSDEIIDAGTGLTVQGVKLPFVKELQIPSLPLTKQKQIVALLDQAFKAIDQAQQNIEKNIANAKELFQSKLNAVFSQSGEGWEERTLGDVCNLFQGLAINAKTKHLLVEKSSLPLLRIKDLKNNSHEQYVSETSYPKKAKINKDDIIYTRTGSLGLVFRKREGILHNNSFKVVPTPELSHNYLFWWLQHESFTKKIIALASRAAQPDITHKLFKKQTITIPSKQDQEKYYKLIEKLNSDITGLISIYKNKINNLEELKKSILQKAFNGELT